jgi:hypothetical protein
MRLLHRLILVAAAVAGAAGCKQGIGDRCQIDSDCASGQCSRGMKPEGICTDLSTSDAPPAAAADAPATVVPDAATFTPDAAAPTPDAAEADAS